MSLKETNRLRIERITQRFQQRRANGRDSADARAAFDAAFVVVREGVLRSLLEDIGAELVRAGHAWSSEVDVHAKKPSVSYRVKLAGAAPLHANTILFFVQHDSPGRPSEVIVELSLRGEFELGRFTSPSEMTRAALEQMVVDGLEHMISCN